MKIFITGSNGFIGRHLVDKSISDGHKVIGLRHSNHIQNTNSSEQLIWLNGTLEDDLSEALSTCDVAIHLAAYGVNPIFDSWQESFHWNVTALLNLLNQMYLAGVKRLVIAGSCSEYGKSAERYEFIPCDAPLEPVSSYGAAKAAATLAAMAYARDKKIELAVLRLFHVYGEGESSNRFWPTLKKAALEGLDFPMTFGEQIRDFTPVEFVAEQFLKYATELPLQPGNPILQNIGTGKPQTLLEFANIWWRIFEGKGKILPGVISYRKNEIMRFVPKI